MTRELAPVDIRHLPEMARLADEVKESGRPPRLVRDGEDVAILTPAPSRRRRRRTITAADREASASLFGAWKDQIDPETFKRERRELQIDDKPPLAL